MYKKFILLAIAAILAQGCAGNSATSGQKSASADQNNPDLICQTVRSTGSMLKNKRCRTREQIEAEREEARNTMNSIHSSAAGSSGIE